MSEASAAVEVAVDPGTAFKVFTEEMDLWHVRSPISFYDAARAIGRRCEPGVDIWFEPTGAGTNVRVEARVPEGGVDRGGTSIMRVGPDWFSSWVARRDDVPHQVVELPRLNLELYYERPVTAMRWLADAFGFDLPPHLPPDDSDGVPPWIETRAGDAALMLSRLAGRPGVSTHVPFVYVDDLDAHYERAARAGATIVEEIHQHGYRRYVCEDVKGHRWSFAQARPTMR